MKRRVMEEKETGQYEGERKGRTLKRRRLVNMKVK